MDTWSICGKNQKYTPEGSAWAHLLHVPPKYHLRYDYSEETGDQHFTPSARTFWILRRTILIFRRECSKYFEVYILPWDETPPQVNPVGRRNDRRNERMEDGLRLKQHREASSSTEWVQYATTSIDILVHVAVFRRQTEADTRWCKRWEKISTGPLVHSIRWLGCVCTRRIILGPFAYSKLVVKDKHHAWFCSPAPPEYHSSWSRPKCYSRRFAIPYDAL